jgi:hypothetical protein
MYRTAQLSLPLLMPSQAQKHVTVNEALLRLDAAVRTSVLSTSESVPPQFPKLGDAYIVPVNAVAEWTGFENRIAVAMNGGWDLLVPKAGWEVFDESTGTHFTFCGTRWLRNPVVFARSGSGIGFNCVELEHQITNGPINVTDVIIPSHSIVFGVSGIVTEEISGSNISGWNLGISGAHDRYGSSIGVQVDSTVIGLASTPASYYADEAMIISSVNGDFRSGRIRLSLFFASFFSPR